MHKPQPSQKIKCKFPHGPERTVTVKSVDENSATAIIQWIDHAEPTPETKGPGLFSDYTVRVPLAWLGE